MNRDGIQRLLMVLAIIAALAVMIILGGGYLRDGKILLAKNQELETSRNTWEKIAEDKEALQEELKEVTNSLKEAKLTLEESTERAEELRQDIEQLKKEIEALKSGN